MTTSHPTPAATTVVSPHLTDESAVRLGIGGMLLFVAAVALAQFGVPAPWSVGVLLAAVALLAAPLAPLHAGFLGVAGGALDDGFLLHADGELGVGVTDAALLTVFVAVALATALGARKAR